MTYNTSETPLFRVGLIGIYQESNTFLNRPTTWEDFLNGHLLRGQEIVDEYTKAHHEIGGIIAAFSKEDTIELVPLFYAEATPSGTISAATAQRLLENMTDALVNSMPLDGLMVVPHGAAVSESFPDFDGMWLQRVRQIVGKQVPIVGTIDPHCNLSEDMANAVNSLIAYKTNPHIDQRKTGEDAAKLLIRMIRKEIFPTMSAIQPRVAISIEMQHTGSEPCLSLYKLADEIAQDPKILSVSIVLGFPYADVAEMGTSFIVIADSDLPKAEALSKRLKDYIEINHTLFSGDKIGLKELPEKLADSEYPVLLLDMGDNAGGGSPGDSTFLLSFMEATSVGPGFICIYDPEAVTQLEDTPLGEWISLKVGGKTDTLHGKPKRIDGKFMENEPRHGGQVKFNMGKSVIVETSKNNIIMLTSLRIVPFSLQQLLAFGLNPNSFHIIVAKGVHAPLAAYMSVCKRLIRVNTPGITTADVNTLVFYNRRIPLFPFESIDLN
nr:microcystin degradation protein MlrC [Cytophagales bacterium]